MDTSKEWVDIISKRLALTIEDINFLASNGRGIGSKDLPKRINALAVFLFVLLEEIRNEPSIGADFRRLGKVALEEILHDMEVKKLEAAVTSLRAGKWDWALKIGALCSLKRSIILLVLTSMLPDELRVPRVNKVLDKTDPRSQFARKLSFIYISNPFAT